MTSTITYNRNSHKTLHSNLENGGPWYKTGKLGAIFATTTYTHPQQAITPGQNTQPTRQLQRRHDDEQQIKHDNNHENDSTNTTDHINQQHPPLHRQRQPLLLQPREREHDNKFIDIAIPGPCTGNCGTGALYRKLPYRGLLPESKIT